MTLLAGAAAASAALPPPTITVVGAAGGGQRYAGNTVTTTLPAGTTAGDLILAFYAQAVYYCNIGAGFTSLYNVDSGGTSVKAGAAYRVATGTADTPVWTKASDDSMAWVNLVLRGDFDAAGIDLGAHQTNGGDPMTVAGVNAGAAGLGVLACHLRVDGQFADPAGCTRQGWAVEGWARMLVHTFPIAAAGVTADLSVDQTSGGADRRTGRQLAVPYNR